MNNELLKRPKRGYFKFRYKYRYARNRLKRQWKKPSKREWWATTHKARYKAKRAHNSKLGMNI